MPHLLHAFSEILPVTLSCDLAQSLLLKPITHLTFKPICLGLIIPLLWAIVFSFIGRWQMIQRTKIWTLYNIEIITNLALFLCSSSSVLNFCAMLLMTWRPMLPPYPAYLSSFWSCQNCVFFFKRWPELRFDTAVLRILHYGPSRVLYAGWPIRRVKYCSEFVLTPCIWLKCFMANENLRRWNWLS